MVAYYSTLRQHFIGFTRIKTNTEVFTLKFISRIYFTNKGLIPVRSILVIKEKSLLVKLICCLKGCIYLTFLIYKCALKATDSVKSCFSMIHMINQKKEIYWNKNSFLYLGKTDAFMHLYGKKKRNPKLCLNMKKNWNKSNLHSALF